jgi:hypothetical protein
MGEVPSPNGDVGNVAEGMMVLKIGRSSGITKGVVNGIPAIVRLYSTHGRTSETTITGIGGQQFGVHGDSGSGVWDEDGRLAGILWGSALRKHTNFITPLHKILQSISNITGAHYGVKGCEIEDRDLLKFRTRIRSYANSVAEDPPSSPTLSSNNHSHSKSSPLDTKMSDTIEVIPTPVQKVSRPPRSMLTVTET